MTNRSRNCCEGAGTHAIVIGGSMAGMLAGRVLADHFDLVTIIERDRYPEAAVTRSGVPQARHLHVLLERGRLILEQLFPGLVDDLIAVGAGLVDTAADFALLNPAGWAVQFNSNIGMLTCSRDLLDWHVRHRLETNPRVRFVSESDVTSLIPAARGAAIAGVTLRRRSGEGDASRDEALYGDLIVDASGRGSRTPKWLDALGYSRVEETVVNAFVGYASRFYRKPAEQSSGRGGIFLQAAPPTNNRAGVAFPIEGDRWIVTLSGGARDYPPSDEAGFLEFARSLRSPIIYDSIKNAEPLSSISMHRGGENRIRHFERMSPWPDRFVVLGDAVSTFNPVYAQGMTAAALSVMALDSCLDRLRSHPGCGLTGVARRFQREVARLNAAPWLFATNEDLRYATTEGARLSWANRLMHRYIDHVLRLNTKSTAVRRRSLKVFHLLKSPATLFHPGTIARVLWEAIKRPAPQVVIGEYSDYSDSRSVARIA